MEIAIVLIIVLLIFGPKKLPELARSAGKSLQEFQSGLRHQHDRDADAEPPGLVEGEAGTAEPAIRQTQRQG
jgi:sec-independent protein translocase protein TatA